ncbi:MAG: thioredoxin family protein [Terricaulis silvestris]
MATQSLMSGLGETAPDFTLVDSEGGAWTLNKVAGDRPVLVAFICNHCPYVVHIADAFAAFASEYQNKGLAVVAISANDVGAYPQDGPDKMADFAEAHRFTFPYLYDESQDVARAYQAVCTPDLYLFDAQRKLAYRGQFDATRPGRGTPTGADLRAAADAVLAGRAPSAEQAPSVGCSIKWKPGKTPAWA